VTIWERRRRRIDEEKGLMKGLFSPIRARGKQLIQLQAAEYSSNKSINPAYENPEPIIFTITIFLRIAWMLPLNLDQNLYSL
jgi:hypothetical protein